MWRRHLQTALVTLLTSTYAAAQTPPDTLASVTHSATFTFMERDGTCVRGRIAKAEATTVTVQPSRMPPVTLQRAKVLQVSQGNALLYSARSSWADVADTHLYPREALVLIIKNRKRIKGAPVEVTSDTIKVKHGLSMTTLPKSDVVIVDYLRVKPPTDGFILAIEEAPFALLFYPEFYYRLAGLEGRIPVRLYDASKPEDNTPLTCAAT
jgi:hypothetical protein